MSEPIEIASPKKSLPELRGMSLDQMQAMLAEAGFEKFRAAQLHQWVFKRGALSIDEMHNLPKAMREWLNDNTALAVAELARLTGEPGQTQKALFKLRDGKLIESVVMREADDDEEGAREPSLCLSSQVGCALDCKFCMTGWGGYQRNLTAAEIVSQAIEIQRRALGDGERIHHMVFMGMGEPMHNLKEVVQAIRVLTDPDGFGLGKRRLTVSTAGVVTGIEKFGAEDLGVNLAVSLNATTDPIRDEVMPINKKWNIAALTKSLRQFPIEPRRRITIEYVLMKGVNDKPEDAHRLVRLLDGIRCKVNLIMYNETPELPYKQVEESTLHGFLKTLTNARITATVRWSKGREIQAACGQLAAHKKES